MDTIIIGGDARFACLRTLLEQRGRTVRHIRGGLGAGDINELAGARNVIANCPTKVGLDLPGLLECVSCDATLWLCGPGHAGEVPAGRRIIDLWTDERLIADNAALTAEGAVSAAMTAARRSLRELPALVVGWGRIGRALTDLLVGMGVPVKAASRSEAHRRQAQARGAEAVDTTAIAEALPGRKLIFNTAPGMVLDAVALRRMDRDAMAVDLASPPYGIDLSAAWAQGLRAWREPGLPGRYCPESAAAALLHAMDRAEEGRG